MVASNKMPTIYMLRGLPASGKSTRRREMLADASFHPIVAINKDEIRREKGIVPGDFRREKEVLAIETEKIEKALRSGVSIILDNLHMTPKFERKYRDLAKEHDYEFVIIDLFHVPLEECIRRDAQRTGHEHVGEDRIRQIYLEYCKNFGVKPPDGFQEKVKKPVVQQIRHRPPIEEMKPRPTPMDQDSNLPKCLVVDLDGTLALKNGRSWFEYHKCESDIVVEPIKEIMFGLLRARTVNHIVFLTGREDSGREAALRWLQFQVGVNWKAMEVVIQDNGEPAEFPVFHLFMKNTGDHRPDIETKKELFDLHVRNKFYVLAILEDRSKVVGMWRELGLTCLQVADGDY